MNIAIVILIVNFDFFKDSEEAGFLGLPIFAGSYSSFSAEWYNNIGKTLTLTLLINIFSPHVSKLLIPVLKLGFRCLDRGCTLEI